MSGRNVVLGVAGGIAAYKACELLRRLRADSHQVTVVPTEAALNFVGAATWEALSGNPVHTGVFAEVPHVNHVRLGQQADLVVIAPATADLLARAAQGRADDLLTNVLLTAACPVLMAPAMHTEMWQHPATVANVGTLRGRGIVVMDPDSGRLTGADSGPGRLPEAADIHAVADTLLASHDTATAAASRDLDGLRVVISAGGTREHLDPVRFLGNASSGLMGLQLARAAALRGARVDLVAAHLEHPVPSGCTVHPVTSTGDLEQTMNELAADADVLIMAVAAADFTPTETSAGKIKKTGDQGLSVELHQTPDVLRGLVQRRRPGQLIVGFAAETAGDPQTLLELGSAKLARKGCDLLVVNDVSGGGVFGAADNHVLLLAPDAGGVRVLGEHSGSKGEIAHRIVDAVGLLERGD